MKNSKPNQELLARDLYMDLKVFLKILSSLPFLFVLFYLKKQMWKTSSSKLYFFKAQLNHKCQGKLSETWKRA